MLPIDAGPEDHGYVVDIVPRYTLKADPFSSHSVILDWLAEGHGRRLLDVGAADGLLSRHLTERGWKVTGIEADAAMAAAGAAHCERMLVADLNRGMPLLDGVFDTIVCGDVLEHLADPAAVLRTLVGALATGGDVVVSVPNVAHLWVRMSLLVGRFEYADRGILDRTHLRFFTRRSLDEMLVAAGLEPVQRATTPVPLYQVAAARWHGPALAALHTASATAARALPRMLGYQFLVRARRRP
jgi:2-polyprenyl-3-methyl-5-hydroxy-6-metoxy-1,4-benzoquinol methylase